VDRRVKIKLVDTNGMWGHIEEVKEDPSSPDILLLKNPDESKDVLSHIEFFDLIHPYPRECYGKDVDYFLNFNISIF